MTRAGGFGRWGRILGLVLAVLALSSGCANLKAVRAFAENSASVAEYTKLVNYYTASLAARQKYQPPSTQAELEALGRAREKQREALLARHKIIKTYMDALGQLAADQTVDFDQKVGGLGSALQKKQILKAQEAAAFSALGKLIARAAADGWRQWKIKELIAEANPPLQAVIASLKGIVERNYASALKTQAEAIAGYYGGIVLEAQRGGGGGAAYQPGITALKELQDQKLQVVHIRLREVTVYSQALGKIAAGHQELFDHRNNLEVKEVMEQMIVYARYLNEARNALDNM